MHVAISRGIDANHPLLQTVSDSPEAAAFRHIAAEVSIACLI